MRTLAQIEEDLREAEAELEQLYTVEHIGLVEAHERALEDIRAFEHKVAEQDAIIDQLEAEAQLANEHASELSMVLGPEYVIDAQPAPTEWTFKTLAGVKPEHKNEGHH